MQQTCSNTNYKFLYNMLFYTIILGINIKTTTCQRKVI